MTDNPESRSNVAGRLLELAGHLAVETPHSIQTLVDFQVKTIKMVINLLREEAGSWAAADGDAVTWIRWSASYLEQLFSTPAAVSTQIRTCPRCGGLAQHEMFRGQLCNFCADDLEVSPLLPLEVELLGKYNGQIEDLKRRCYQGDDTTEKVWDSEYAQDLLDKAGIEWRRDETP